MEVNAKATLKSSHNLTYEELKRTQKAGKLTVVAGHNLTYEELKLVLVSITVTVP